MTQTTEAEFMAARTSRFNQHLLTLIVLLFIVHGAYATEATKEEAADTELQEATVRTEHRQHYISAQDALNRRQMTRYREHLAKLEDYPLRPYLEYTDISRRIRRLPADDISRFLADYPSSLLAERLERQWLRTLAAQQKWQQYLAFFHDSLNDTELTCHALFARLKTGDETALYEVEPLWNVGESQPDACDPLFARWMAAGQLTPDIAWDRHYKAVRARNPGLAAYISRLMPEGSLRNNADLLREVDRNPQLLRQQARFSNQSAETQQVILHGIERLALRDAPLALSLWHRYDAQQLFVDFQRVDIQHHIASRLMRQGHRQDAEILLAESPHLNSETLTEWMIRDSLRRQEWDKAYYWIGKLPEDVQQTPRWRYWQARAMEVLDIKPAENQPSARELYTSVAMTRGFYGFMAADLIQQEYRLLDKPLEIPKELLANIEQLPAIQRARELYIMGELLDANREWFHTIRQMDTESVVAAGKLAEQWGWHRKGIQAMIEARSWDDLQLRFPLAYQEQMAQAAQDTAINQHLLFAIARQESSFTPDARSPAGALGLMQLMPSTAQYTARRAGIPYRQHDLLTPEKNIELGSRYLHQLLNEFNGNRILAAAAYNAGPSRVRQWLSKDNQQLPYDIWIETIPFQETRGYVQNVLAFSVIYGYRLGDQLPLITMEEANKPL